MQMSATAAAAAAAAQADDTSSVFPPPPGFVDIARGGGGLPRHVLAAVAGAQVFVKEHDRTASCIYIQLKKKCLHVVMQSICRRLIPPLRFAFANDLAAARCVHSAAM